jgi:hypothetical protein
MIDKITNIFFVFIQVIIKTYVNHIVSMILNISWLILNVSLTLRVEI